MSERTKLPDELKNNIKGFIENNKTKSNFEIASIFDVSESTVSMIKSGMGLTKQKYDIDDYLIENYHQKSISQMSKELKVTRNTVRIYAEKLGLQKYKKYKRKPFEIECDLKYFDEELEKYCITSEGRIFNKETKFILSEKKNANGYWIVTFCTQNKRKYVLKHRMLAFFFVPKTRSSYNVVNHLDGVKNNCTLFNLEWTDVRGNGQHASKAGLLRKGENHRSSKMTTEQVMKLIEFYNNGGTKKEAIEKFDFVTKSIAEKIYNKSRWKHLIKYMKW